MARCCSSAAWPEKAGDLAKARQHYAAAVALAEDADPVRPEVAAARAFVVQAR
jgi:hypothetical protein